MPGSSSPNLTTIYEPKSDSQPHHDVLVLSEASFRQHLLYIKRQIKAQNVVMDCPTRRMKMVAGREEDMAIVECEDAQHMVKKAKAKAKAKAFTDFHQELLTHWATDTSPILAQVIFSPPIAVGASPEQYTQDVAVIDIDTSKIDSNSFASNVIDLGTKFSPEVLIPMMHPNLEDIHNFDFPGDHLLRLRGTIADDEMRSLRCMTRTAIPVSWSSSVAGLPA